MCRDQVGLGHGDRSLEVRGTDRGEHVAGLDLAPTATFTAVTVPAVRKAAVTWSTRSTDPDRAIDWVTDPVATVAVRSPVVAAPLGTASATR